MKDIFNGSDHVIATTACIAGPLGQILLEGKRAEKRVNSLADKARVLKSDYETWNIAQKEYLAYVDEEKKLKLERKEYTAYTKKSYILQAEKDPKKEGHV